MFFKALQKIAQWLGALPSDPHSLAAGDSALKPPPATRLVALVSSPRLPI